MEVDREFDEEVRASPLTPQQWRIAMTAVEFDIEGSEDPETATLVADTSKLRHVVPELDDVGDARGRPGDSSGGGLVDAFRDALGLGGGDDERAAAAADLADRYAAELQAHLEREGRWAEFCRLAAADGENES
jgi:hypothetical protein